MRRSPRPLAVLPAGTSDRRPPATAQPLENVDTIYVDDIRLCPRRCTKPSGLDLTGDGNGDCVVNRLDRALMAGYWPSSRLYMGRMPSRIPSV